MRQPNITKRVARAGKRIRDSLYSNLKPYIAAHFPSFCLQIPLLTSTQYLNIRYFIHHHIYWMFCIYQVLLFSKIILSNNKETTTAQSIFS